MARTVDTSSTFEDWRQRYNGLATDVGGLADLTTADKTSVVNAINYIMDQYFYFLHKTKIFLLYMEDKQEQNLLYFYQHKIY